MSAGRFKSLRRIGVLLHAMLFVGCAGIGSPSSEKTKETATSKLKSNESIQVVLEPMILGKDSWHAVEILRREGFEPWELDKQSPHERRIRCGRDEPAGFMVTCSRRLEISLDDKGCVSGLQVTSGLTGP